MFAVSIYTPYTIPVTKYAIRSYIFILCHLMYLSVHVYNGCVYIYMPVGINKFFFIYFLVYITVECLHYILYITLIFLHFHIL